MINTYKIKDYLQEVFMSDYTGTDDDGPDSFEKWMEDMTQDELLDYADKFAEIISKTVPH